MLENGPDKTTIYFFPSDKNPNDVHSILMFIKWVNGNIINRPSVFEIIMSLIAKIHFIHLFLLLYFSCTGKEILIKVRFPH